MKALALMIAVLVLLLAAFLVGREVGYVQAENQRLWWPAAR